MTRSRTIAGKGPKAVEPELEDLVFVGFNSRIAALRRDSGELAWSWKSPKGSGFVALLLDGDALIASVDGYTYALDPRTGEQRWANDLQGFGTGVPSLASVRGNNVAFATLAELRRLAELNRTATHVVLPATGR
jgi:outer membrane protein assembly factor BamB